MDQSDLDKVLAVYNSVTPSRRRWVRNRNHMRNSWKELFQVLERASGRDGVKLAVFDPNWHEVAAKGSTTGAVNKQVKQTELTNQEDDEMGQTKAEQEGVELSLKSEGAVDANGRVTADQTGVSIDPVTNKADAMVKDKPQGVDTKLIEKKADVEKVDDVVANVALDKGDAEATPEDATKADATGDSKDTNSRKTAKKNAKK